jgi:hypothetical protein
MVREEMPGTSRLSGMTVFALAIGVSVAILGAGATTLLKPTSAQASAKFTAQTKLPCTRCHTSANGAGAGNLTDFGKEFQANGNQLPKKK